MDQTSLGTRVCRVRRDQKAAGSYCARQGMQLVPTELWLRQQRILPSGKWDSAHSQRNPVPLPDTSGHQWHVWTKVTLRFSPSGQPWVHVPQT